MTNPLTALDQWYQTPLGHYVLQQERMQLRSVLTQCTGRHLLQIGGPSDMRFCDISPIKHRVYLGADSNWIFGRVRILAELDELPLLPQSIDATLLVHILEFVDQPLTLLRSLYQATAPGGYIILLCFNPYSLWRLQRLCHNDLVTDLGRPLSSTKLTHLLRQAGFSQVSSRRFYSSPALLQSHHRVYQWKWLEAFGAVLGGSFSAINLVVAKKQESAKITDSIVSWCKAKTPVARRTVEPTSQVKGEL